MRGGHGPALKRADYGDRVARALLAVALVNFFGFLIAGQVIGGYPVHGGFDSGGYYLAKTAHGPRTQVSKRTFDYSRLHERAMFVTHFVAIGAGWLLYKRRSKR